MNVCCYAHAIYLTSNGLGCALFLIWLCILPGAPVSTGIYICLQDNFHDMGNIQLATWCPSFNFLLSLSLFAHMFSCWVGASWVLFVGGTCLVLPCYSTRMGRESLLFRCAPLPCFLDVAAPLGGEAILKFGRSFIFSSVSIPCCSS